MAGLVMALRCRDGIVLGGDIPCGLLPESDSIIQPLSEQVAVLAHDNREFALQLIDSFRSSSPNLDAGVEDIATQACSSFDQKCRELSKEGKGIPLVGFIIAGIDRGECIRLYGLHIGNQFAPRAFQGNVFGGRFNSIARLLDQKMHSFSYDTDRILPYASFYYLESKIVPEFLIEPCLALATITYNVGFQQVDPDRVRDLMERAGDWSETMAANCISLFRPKNEDEKP